MIRWMTLLVDDDDAGESWWCWWLSFPLQKTMVFRCFLKFRQGIMVNVGWPRLKPRTPFRVMRRTYEDASHSIPEYTRIYPVQAQTVRAYISFKYRMCGNLFPSSSEHTRIYPIQVLSVREIIPLKSTLYGHLSQHRPNIAPKSILTSVLEIYFRVRSPYLKIIFGYGLRTWK